MKLYIVLLTCFAVSMAVTPARADLLLDLRLDDGTAMRSVSSGSTVLVDMFLRDTDASTPMAADGLSSGGGRIFRSAGTAAVTDVGPTTAGANTGPDWVAPPTSPVAGVAAGTISSVLALAPFTFPVPTTVGVGQTSIHIARFALNVTGTFGETATLTADTLGAAGVANIAGALPGPTTNLDAILDGGGAGIGFGSVQLTVVPEASTFLVASLLGGGLLWLRRRRIAAPVSTAQSA